MRHYRGIKKFLLPSIALHLILLVLALILYNGNYKTHSATPYEVRFITINNDINNILKSYKKETKDDHLEKVKKNKFEDSSRVKKVNDNTSYKENASNEVKGKPQNIEKDNKSVSNSLSIDTTRQNVSTAINTHEKAYPDYSLNPKPIYPLIARRRGYEGTVLLRVRVWKMVK